MNHIKALLEHYEFWLSASLLLGVGINLFGAWNFFRNPEKSAKDLGMDLVNLDNSYRHSTLTLMRLAGVCLVALAIFYFVTALGPVQQAWSVVAAVLARATGIIFYGWNLVKFKGPPKFLFYLCVNSLLALSHGILLACSPGGLAGLQNDLSSFFWIRFFQSF